MCGIVGILGREPVTGSLVDALKRLEYRGYDSAGIATLEKAQLTRRRAQGKLHNLEARLARDPLAGTVGIGHTRWATHGTAGRLASFASARYRESVATNRLHSEPNLTERLYEEEKPGTKAPFFRFFSKLLEHTSNNLLLRADPGSS
jgi:glutamine phosphoribosylpyrophosphate amidotransferase